MSGYNRHSKLKEIPCDPCREAQRQWWRDRRVSHGTHINILRREWRARTPNANRNRENGEQELQMQIEIVCIGQMLMAGK